MAIKWVIGIDEVGRGPLAGPVTVCALLMRASEHRKLRGNFDSKKFSPKKRVKIAKLLENYKIASVSNKIIDKKGIVFALNLAIKRVLRDPIPKLAQILLDGGLRAPKHFKNQKTIIKGDASEPIIGLASVLAKVHRDRKMVNLSIRYPSWGFEKQKGYGTRGHYALIRKHGLAPIHRRSFLRRLTLSAR